MARFRIIFNVTKFFTFREFENDTMIKRLVLIEIEMKCNCKSYKISIVPIYSFNITRQFTLSIHEQIK